MKRVIVKNPKRLLEGHLWVFSKEIYGSLKGFEPGELVELVDRSGNFLGTGYINPQSYITVRLLSRRKTDAGEAFFRQRLTEALLYRQGLYQGSDTYRWVFSESDLLPGLVVDRYSDVVVVQILTAGMERLKERILKVIRDTISPGCIVLRNDSPYRELEGLSLQKAIVHGELRSLPVITEGELRFYVDPLEGQKTGFFLDQRENRLAFSTMLQEGEGLDLFCYTAPWGLHMAQRGIRVTAVDSSDVALQMARQNAELNGLQDRITFLSADVFEFLTELRSTGKRYDYIVLDPPAFVKSRSTLRNAIKGYRSINANAMAVLKRGGMMATSSCSHHLTEEAFLDVLHYAARANNRYLRIVELRGQARDHPVLLSMPETRYLKCAILQIL